MNLMDNKESTYNTALGQQLNFGKGRDEAQREYELGQREEKVIQKEKELQNLMDEMKN